MAKRAPRLIPWSPDVLCCDADVCAPVPSDTVLYANAEHIPQHFFRSSSSSGRGAHCDCIVLGVCPGIGRVAVVYELKALGMLYSIVARLLSPERSGHGVREEAKTLINQLKLDTKLSNCVNVALKLADTIGFQLEDIAAVLVAGVEDKEQLHKSLKRIIEESYGRDRETVPDMLLRTVSIVAEQLIRMLIALLVQSLSGKAKVLIRHNKIRWTKVCEALREL